MTKSTEWLLRLALLITMIYFGWQLAAQTVVQLIQQNAQIAELQRQLHPAADKSAPNPGAVIK